MNGRQKEVQKQFIDNEQKVLNDLKKVYADALKGIENNIENLMARADADTPTVVYQIEYQKAIQGQISAILDEMNSKQFTTVADYLGTCYEDGFIGTMYDLQGQGVPLVIPLNQEQIVQAVQLDSKINSGMYAAFGEDTKKLKKNITAQVTRGIATGMSYQQVAQQISMRMIGTKYKTGGQLARAMTIARTEGHRVQCKAGMDALFKAKSKGANVVKQWDSTLDGRTRESHRAVDGEIREIDEKFSNGLRYPGDPDGPAAEVCNCRCALLQRARSALKEPFSKWDGENGELVDFSGIDDYNDFKKKYNYFTVPKDVSISKNKYGKQIEFDFKGKEEKFAESTKIIKSLSDEYSTRLEKVTVGAQKLAGSVNMSGALMHLSASHPDVAIHEFAHTLANSSAQKYGLTDDEGFWKEIKSIKRAYRKDVNKEDNPTRWISFYEHSTENIDEFFAEAFTHAKMRELGYEIPSKYGSDFTYSEKVLAATNKYFQRNKNASEQPKTNNTSLKINIQLFARKSSDFPTIHLQKQEYAHVMSEIATNITKEQAEKKVFKKYIGNYLYTVENNGFGNYRIIGKKEIK